MKDGHGGVVIGSEVSGGARNVFAERCRMDSPQLDRALRFKTNSVRGGVIEHVYMRDVTVGQVAEAVVTADFFYEEGDSGKFPPTLRDVELRNVTSQKSQHGLRLRGYAHSPITDVRIVDCVFDGVAAGRRPRRGPGPGAHERPGERPGPERPHHALDSRGRVSDSRLRPGPKPASLKPVA